MKLVITLIKDNSGEVGENMEPGEVVVFNISAEEAINIQNAMSTENFDKLKEFFQSMKDINGKKHDIGINDIYGFEFRL